MKPAAVAARRIIARSSERVTSETIKSAKSYLWLWVNCFGCPKSARQSPVRQHDSLNHQYEKEYQQHAKCEPFVANEPEGNSENHQRRHVYLFTLYPTADYTDIVASRSRLLLLSRWHQTLIIAEYPYLLHALRVGGVVRGVHPAVRSTLSLSGYKSR